MKRVSVRTTSKKEVVPVQQGTPERVSPVPEKPVKETSVVAPRKSTRKRVYRELTPQEKAMIEELSDDSDDEEYVPGNSSSDESGSEGSDDSDSD